MADLVGEDHAARGYNQFFDHRQRGIGFEASDDPALCRVELGPPGIVIIAQIENVGGAGLDRHRLGGGDVVDPRRGDRGIDRPVGIGIVNDVQLGAAHALGKPCPIAAARVEPQTRRIDQIGGLGQATAQSTMGAADHQTQQRGEEFGRPVVVGVRQGRTPRQFGAQMVEPRPMALNPADNLTQARRASKLPVQHGQKLTFRRQPANPSIGPVLDHQCVELLPRDVLQQLMKNAIVMAHGTDPRSCPDRSPTIPAQWNQCRTPCTAKNVPDNRGRLPALRSVSSIGVSTSSQKLMNSFYSGSRMLHTTQT